MNYQTKRLNIKSKEDVSIDVGNQKMEILKSTTLAGFDLEKSQHNLIRPSAEREKGNLNIEDRSESIDLKDNNILKSLTPGIHEHKSGTENEHKDPRVRDKKLQVPSVISIHKKEQPGEELCNAIIDIKDTESLQNFEKVEKKDCEEDFIDLIGDELVEDAETVLMTTSVIETESDTKEASVRRVSVVRKLRKLPGVYRTVATQTPSNTYYKEGGKKFWEHYNVKLGVTSENLVSGNLTNRSDVKEIYKIEESIDTMCKNSEILDKDVSMNNTKDLIEISTISNEKSKRFSDEKVDISDLVAPNIKGQNYLDEQKRGGSIKERLEKKEQLDEAKSKIMNLKGLQNSDEQDSHSIAEKAKQLSEKKRIESLANKSMIEVKEMSNTVTDDSKTLIETESSERFEKDGQIKIVEIKSAEYLFGDQTMEETSTEKTNLKRARINDVDFPSVKIDAEERERLIQKLKFVKTEKKQSEDTREFRLSGEPSLDYCKQQDPVSEDNNFPTEDEKTVSQTNLEMVREYDSDKATMSTDSTDDTYRESVSDKAFPKPIASEGNFEALIFKRDTNTTCEPVSVDDIFADQKEEEQMQPNKRKIRLALKSEDSKDTEEAKLKSSLKKNRPIDRLMQSNASKKVTFGDQLTPCSTKEAESLDNVGVSSTTDDYDGLQINLKSATNNNTYISDILENLSEQEKHDFKQGIKDSSDIMKSLESCMLDEKQLGTKNEEDWKKVKAGDMGNTEKHNPSTITEKSSIVTEPHEENENYPQTISKTQAIGDRMTKRENTSDAISLHNEEKDDGRQQLDVNIYKTEVESNYYEEEAPNKDSVIDLFSTKKENDPCNFENTKISLKARKSENEKNLKKVDKSKTSVLQDRLKTLNTKTKEKIDSKPQKNVGEKNQSDQTKSMIKGDIDKLVQNSATIEAASCENESIKVELKTATILGTSQGDGPRSEMSSKQIVGCSDTLKSEIDTVTEKESNKNQINLFDSSVEDEEISLKSMKKGLKARKTQEVSDVQKIDEDKNNVLKDRLKGLKNKTNVNLEEISKDIRKDENELYQIKIGLISNEANSIDVQTESKEINAKEDILQQKENLKTLVKSTKNVNSILDSILPAENNSPETQPKKIFHESDIDMQVLTEKTEGEVVNNSNEDNATRQYPENGEAIILKDKLKSLHKREDISVNENDIDLFDASNEEELSLKSMKKGLKTRKQPEILDTHKIDLNKSDSLKDRLQTLKNNKKTEVEISKQEDQNKGTKTEKLKNLKKTDFKSIDPKVNQEENQVQKEMLEKISILKASGEVVEEVSDVLESLISIDENQPITSSSRSDKILEALNVETGKSADIYVRQADNSIKEINQKFIVSDSDERLDLKGELKGLKKHQSLNIFATNSDQEDDEVTTKKRLLKSRKKTEDQPSIKIDTTVKDSLQERLKGLKKKVESSNDDQLDSKKVEESELQRKMIKNAEENTKRLALPDVSTVLESIVDVESKYADSKQKSAPLGAELFADLIEFQKQDQVALQEAMIAQQKNREGSNIPQQFSASSDGNVIDLKDHLKGLKQNQETSAVDLFSGKVDESVLETKKAKQRLKKRTQEEKGDERIMRLSADQEAVKQRLDRLKQKKISEIEQKVPETTKKHKSEETSEYEMLKSGLKTTERLAEKKTSEDETSEAISALSKLKSDKKEEATIDIEKFIGKEVDRKDDKRSGESIDTLLKSIQDATRDDDLENRATMESKRSSAVAPEQTFILFDDTEEVDLTEKAKGLRKRLKQAEEDQMKSSKPDEYQLQLQEKAARMRAEAKRLEQMEKEKAELLKKAEKDKSAQAQMLKMGLKKIETVLDSEKIKEMSTEASEAMSKLKKINDSDESDTVDAKALIDSITEEAKNAHNQKSDIKVGVDLFAELSELQRQEQEELTKLQEAQRLKAAESAAATQQFVVLGDDEAHDLTSSLKALKKKEDQHVFASTASLFGEEKEDAEDQRALKSMRKSLKQRKLEEGEIPATPSVATADQEAVKKRLESLKQRKLSDLLTKKETEKPDEENDELRQLKTGLKSVKDAMSAESYDDDDEEEKTAEIKNAMKKLTKLDTNDKPSFLKEGEDITSLLQEETLEMEARKQEVAQKKFEANSLLQSIELATRDDELEARAKAESEAASKKKADEASSTNQSFIFMPTEEEEDITSKRKGLRQRLRKSVESIEASPDPYEEEVKNRLQNLRKQTREMEQKEKKKMESIRQEDDRMQMLKANLRKAEENIQKQIEEEEEAEREAAAMMAKLRRVDVKDDEEKKKFGFKGDDSWADAVSNLIGNEAELLRQRLEAAKQKESEDMFAELAEIKRQEEEELKLLKEQQAKVEEAKAKKAVQQFVLFGEDSEEVDLGAQLKGLKARATNATSEPEALRPLSVEQEEMKNRLQALMQKKKEQAEKEKKESIEFEIKTAKDQAILDMKAGLKTMNREEVEEQKRKKVFDDEPFEAQSIKDRLKKREGDGITLEKIDLSKEAKRQREEELLNRKKGMKKVEIDEEKLRKFEITEEDLMIHAHEKTDTSELNNLLMQQLEESQKMLEEQRLMALERERSKAEAAAKKADVVISYLDEDDYESHVKEEAEKEEFRLKQEEMEYKMKIMTVRNKVKDKGGLALDWDSFKPASKMEKTSSESNESTAFMEVLGSLSKIERHYEYQEWSDEESVVDEGDEDDIPYIQLYLEKVSAGVTCGDYEKNGTCKHIFGCRFGDYTHKECQEVCKEFHPSTFLGLWALGSQSSNPVL